MRATPRARGASKRDDADARRSTRDARARRLVVFRRGAYKGLKEKPPFRTTWDVPCERLDVKLGHRDGTASRFGSTVTVSCDVAPVGAHGFFLAAAIRGAVDCACASCGVVFAHALPERRDDDDDDASSTRRARSPPGSIQISSPPSDGASSASGDAEVYPFPPSRRRRSISPISSSTRSTPSACPTSACATPVAPPNRVPGPPSRDVIVIRHPSFSKKKQTEQNRTEPNRRVALDAPNRRRAVARRRSIDAFASASRDDRPARLLARRDRGVAPNANATLRVPSGRPLGSPRRNVASALSRARMTSAYRALAFAAHGLQGVPRRRARAPERLPPAARPRPERRRVRRHGREPGHRIRGRRRARRARRARALRVPGRGAREGGGGGAERARAPGGARTRTRGAALRAI